MARERTKTGVELYRFAEAVDATRAWQFFGITGHYDDDDYTAYAISRGPIPAVEPSDFGDIAECVTVDSPPDDEYRKVHIARYAGDLAGLHLFTESLTGVLDRGAEGDIDMIRELGGPVFLLGAVASANQWATDLLGTFGPE